MRSALWTTRYSAVLLRFVLRALHCRLRLIALYGIALGASRFSNVLRTSAFYNTTSVLRALHFVMRDQRFVLRALYFILNAPGSTLCVERSALYVMC